MESDDHSFSARLRVRRFFNGRYEYAELSVGGGRGSDNRTVAQQTDLDSSAIRAEYRRRVKHRLILIGTVGFRNEEITASRERDSYFVRIGFGRLF